MNHAGRRSSLISPKLYGTYEKLLQGLTPEEITPYEASDKFWSNLFSLTVDRPYLQALLSQISKEHCVGILKPALNILFSSCLSFARSADNTDVRKLHAVETLSIVVRSVLAKNLSGWEVMEALGGGVSQSDAIFTDFVIVVNHIISDECAPASLRHQVLQLALTFMCGIGSLSPGAYFLRRDLFPSLVSFMKSPDTERFSFEGTVLLSSLANYHKSDAAKLNPYIQRIKDTQDQDFMRKICWACNFALEAAIRSYQNISDDSPPTLTSTIGSMVGYLLPDRALASRSVDPPQMLFKNQPIEASVVLISIFEFIRLNPSFSTLLIESMSDSSTPSRSYPLVSTIISLSSYVVTHASSSSSPRSMTYANLCLNVLLALVENNNVVDVLCQPSTGSIRICRQRLPVLPVPSSARPPICAILDCCILWLRHNLQKRLEVSSYITCIWTCYRVVWHLQKSRVRLDYHWQELWGAILGLLNFLSTKLDILATTGGVEQLAREERQFTISLLDLALTKSEIFLPTSRHIHEFIYELVRSSAVLKKQATLLQTLAPPQQPTSSRRPSWTANSTEELDHLLSIANTYEEKVTAAGARTASAAMRAVAKSIDADGLHGAKESKDVEEPLTRSEDMLGFARYVSMDGLALLP